MLEQSLFESKIEHCDLRFRESFPKSFRAVISQDVSEASDSF